MTGYAPKLRPEQHWPKPTPRQCWESCVANMEADARALARARADYEAAQAGANGIVEIRNRMDQYANGARHWKRLASWWAEQLPPEPGQDDE